MAKGGAISLVQLPVYTSPLQFAHISCEGASHARTTQGGIIARDKHLRQWKQRNNMSVPHTKEPFQAP